MTDVGIERGSPNASIERGGPNASIERGGPNASIERGGSNAPGEATEAASGADPRQDPAVRSRLRWILAGIVLLCLLLGAAGFAFVQWMATLPPGTLKKP